MMVVVTFIIFIINCTSVSRISSPWSGSMVWVRRARLRWTKDQRKGWACPLRSGMFSSSSTPYSLLHPVHVTCLSTVCMGLFPFMGSVVEPGMWQTIQVETPLSPQKKKKTKMAASMFQNTTPNRMEGCSNKDFKTLWQSCLFKLHKIVWFWISICVELCEMFIFFNFLCSFVALLLCVSCLLYFVVIATSEILCLFATFSRTPLPPPPMTFSTQWHLAADDCVQQIMPLLYHACALYVTGYDRRDLSFSSTLFIPREAIQLGWAHEYKKLNENKQ